MPRNPSAKQAMIRETMTPKERVWAAIGLESCDRVPVVPLMDVMFPAKHKGMTAAYVMSHWEEGQQAILDIYDELGGWDAIILCANSRPLTPTLSAGVVASLTQKGYRLPTQDSTGPANSQPQVEEREVLTIEDYEEISRLGLNRFLEEHYQRFVSFTPEKIITWTQRQTVRYIKAKEEWDEKGVPSLCGAIAESPLMFLSMKRSLTMFTMDLHRIPDKVQAAMDAMVDDMIKEAIAAARLTGIMGVFLTLERGGGFYYPLKIFERFEFPYVKKMVEAFALEGILTVLHFDQDWTLNLPYLKELPAKMCICELDSTTDIFKAKEILRDHMCIMGDVPASLFAYGSRQEVEAYCERLIEVVGNGGGYILSSGCSVPVDAKFENVKAMIDTGKRRLHRSGKDIIREKAGQ